MNVNECCKRSVVVIDLSADIVQAAQLMRANHVGLLVVLDATSNKRAPVGVITDRDIVVQVDAKEVNPRSVTVGEVMARSPVVAVENESLSALVQGMRMAGVRRAPVVDTNGALTGIIAIDDVVDLMTGLLCDITGTIRNEQRTERRARVS